MKEYILFAMWIMSAVVTTIHAVSPTKPACPWSRTDITILVDMKKSAGSEVHTETVKPFLYSFVRQLTSDLKRPEHKNQRVRLAVSRYGAKLTTLHKHSGSQDHVSLLKSVQSLRFEPGIMTTDEALSMCMRNKCHSTTGAKPNKQIIIVLTNGIKDKTADVSRAIAAYKKVGITIVPVGIDVKNNDKVLKAINTNAEDIGNKCTYDEFTTAFLLKLRQQQCGSKVPPPPPKPKKTQIDMAFLIDASASLLELQFKQETTFAKKLMESLADGKTDARIAALTFASQVNTQFTMTPNSAVLRKRVLDLKFASGSRTYTDTAIKAATDELFGSKYKQRPGTTKKFMVVITDGAPTRKKKIADYVKAAQAKGITILGVAIGKTMMTKNKAKMLLIVGGKEENLFIASDFTKLGSQFDKVVKKIKA